MAKRIQTNQGGLSWTEIPGDPNVPRCDQCQMLAINGVNTHEHGCPNSRKTWVSDRGWVLFLECPECGSEVEKGEACCDGGPGEEEE